MTLARHIAVEVLSRAQQDRRFAADILEEYHPQLSPLDRRFVMQLVMGTVRMRGTLDALIKPFLTRPIESMHPQTLEILRTGAYQLAYLTQIPKHAAVHESVEITPTPVKKFVNAILRKMCDLVTDEYTDSPGSNALPVFVKDHQYRNLTQRIFPDPATRLEQYLFYAFSMPPWLAQRWLTRYDRDECLRLGFWFNTPAPLWIRVNSLRLSRDEYSRQLVEQNITHEPGEHPQSLKILDSVPVRDLPGYERGDFCVQDHSSMLVASALDPKSGWNVLDLCSAPGGKTTHLAELMDNQGQITACDIVPERLNTVVELSRRVGVNIVQPHLIKDDEIPLGPFDAALVDAPCSNTGVLGRRPEVRWRLQPQELQHLVPLQIRLLASAVQRVRKGGTIVYSTCSIEPEENEGVVSAVCQQYPDLRCEAEQTAIPGQPADGGYWARLVKT